MCRAITFVTSERANSNNSNVESFNTASGNESDLINNGTSYTRLLNETCRIKKTNFNLLGVIHQLESILERFLTNMQ